MSATMILALLSVSRVLREEGCSHFNFPSPTRNELASVNAGSAIWLML